MEIIAKTTDGCLIQATEAEVKEILKAVSGELPDKITIGQKLPAIDYASTITKIKALEKNDKYRYLLSDIDTFNKTVDTLKMAVQNASSIDV